MKKLLLLLLVITAHTDKIVSQDVEKIDRLYADAIDNWVSSSHKAYPFFDSLYYYLQPLYNRYPNQLSIPDEIHKIARNYIRFMYDYTLKFGASQGIENGWKMLQEIKGYEALKAYNTSILSTKGGTYSNLLPQINSSNIYDFHKLERLNNNIQARLPNSDLFLKVPTIKDIQSTLQANEVYISFLFSLNDRSFYIVRITRDTKKVIKSKATTFELINRVALIKSILENDQNLMAVAEMNLDLIKARDDIDLMANFNFIQNQVVDCFSIQPGQRLIIENDIFVNMIPFDIIRNSVTNRFLIEDNEIFYVPNAAFFLKLRQKPKPSAFITALGVSAGRSVGDIDPENEVELMKDFFSPTNLLLEKNGDRDKILALIQRPEHYNVIHLSSHFRRKSIGMRDQHQYLPDISDYSIYTFQGERYTYYFEFSNSELYPSEILENSNLESDLVIFSGCETGTSDNVLDIINPLGIGVKMGEIDPNGRSISMNYLAILNGGCYCNSTESFSNLSIMTLPFHAKYAIAFQNKIDPMNAEQFFRQFYDYLQYYMDVPTAFRKTKLDFLNRIPDGIYDHFLIILISG